MFKKSLIITSGTLALSALVWVSLPGHLGWAQQLLQPYRHERSISLRELAPLLDERPVAASLTRHWRNLPYDATKGRALAEDARAHSSGTKWNCYAYVARAIHRQTGPFLEGMHAYMAAEHLAQSPHFIEIEVAVAELAQLPAGAIVVWGQGDSRSGHISIADGDGNEISDHVAPQMHKHYGGAAHRTFLPVSPQF